MVALTIAAAVPVAGAWRDRAVVPASPWVFGYTLSIAAMIAVLTATVPVGGEALKSAVFSAHWLPATTAGVMPFLAVRAYLGRPVSVRSPLGVGILAGVAITLGLVFSNPFHHLVWDGLLTSARAGDALLVAPGPLYGLGYVLSSGLVVAACLLLVRANMRAPRIHHGVLQFVAAATVAPAIAAIPAAVGRYGLAYPVAAGGLMVGGWSLRWCMARHPVAIQSARDMRGTRDTIVEVMPEGVVVIDAAGVVVDENPSALRLLGLPHHILGTDAASALPAWLAQAITDTETTATLSRDDSATGTTLDVTITRVLGDATDSAGDVVVVMRDGTERARAQARLDQLAHTDTLTGLPNRSHLDRELAQRRERGEATALVLLDLDGFKAVNDAYGHARGDDLLRAVARRLSALPIDGGFVARLGGDEFVVLAPCDDPAAGEHLAQRVSDAFGQEVWAGASVRLRLGASIGVAMIPTHGTTVAEVLRCADVAMYNAKASGGRVQLYHPDRDPNTPERVRGVSDLRSAVARGELVLHHQPVFDLHTGRCVGAEALVRWQHPTRGLLMPAQFLDLVPEAGIARDLARWVVARALDERMQLSPPGGVFRVAFNLTAADLADRGLIDDLLSAIAATSLSPDEVVVEITEMVFMAPSPDSEERSSIARLREAGVRIVMDDFGTGHASITMLRELRGTTAKIAGPLVAGVADNPDDLALMRGLVNLARRLDYLVLAEWIETPEVLHLVRDAGVRFAQGYLLARPMPIDDLAAWLPLHADGLPVIHA